MTTTEPLKNIKWAAEQLQIHEITAYRLAKNGQIPGAFKLGGKGRWFVNTEIFNEFSRGEK